MILGFVILGPIVLNAAGGFTEMHIKYAEFNPAGISLNGRPAADVVISSFLVWGFFQVGGQPASITRFQTSLGYQEAQICSEYSICL